MKKMMSFIWVATAAMAMLVLSGCGGGTADTATGTGTPAATPGATTETTTPPADTQEQINLSIAWWGGDSRHNATLEAIRLYEELNPHISIEAFYQGFGGFYDQFVIRLAGGEEWDIIQNDIQWLHELTVRFDSFVDLFEFEDIFDFSMFDESAMDAATIEGRLTAIPASGNALMLIVNEDLMNRYEIFVDDWTWDDILEQGMRLNEISSDYFLLNLPPNVMVDGFMQTFIKQQTGLPLVLDDYTLGFDESHAEEFFSFVLQMIEGGVIQSFEEAALFNFLMATNPAWLEGRIFAAPNLGSQVTALSGHGFELGIQRYPIAANAVDPGIMVRPGILFSLSNSSPHIEEAARFVNWMLTDFEAIVALSDQRGVPASDLARDILLGEGAISQSLIDGHNEAVAHAATIADGHLNTNAQVRAILLNMVESVGFRVISPEQAASQLVSELEILLDQLSAGI